MVITGEIKEVSKTSFTIGQKVVVQQIIRVEYNFYRFVTTICFAASEDFALPTDLNQLYNFDFDIRTKYIGDKIYTDFFLKNVLPASKIGDDNYLIVAKTNFKKERIEILKSEEIKGRTKHTVALFPDDIKQRIIYAYYWEDNSHLADINEVELLQLNCKSLPYKNKWINNVEVWRTITNDNYIGSII
nr:hypothetical protein [uncultured Flavobacterium sp.]